MTKKILCFLSVGVLLFSISCGGKSKKTELQFLEVLTSPERTKVLKDVIARYEAKNPNIKINLISPPYEQADNKLTMMLNANETLDIIEVRDHTLKQLVNNQKLLNIEEALASWDESKDWTGVAWSAARNVDNTAYFYPASFFIRALFVRTDVLAKLGVTKMPTTYEELFAVCKQITSPKDNQYGFAFRGKGNVSSWDTTMLSAAKNVDTNLNRAVWTTDGKLVFDDPNVVKIFKEYIDMFNKSVPSDGINWGFNEQVNAFISGVTPFLIQDPDTIAILDKQLGRDKYSIIPLPVGAATGKSAIYFGYSGFGVTSYSKYTKESIDFLEFLCGKTENEEWSKNYGTLPAYQSLYAEGSYFSTGIYKAWGDMLSQPDKYIFVQMPMDSPKYPGWVQIEEQYYQAALLGQITPEEALKKWSEYWKK